MRLPALHIAMVATLMLSACAHKGPAFGPLLPGAKVVIKLSSALRFEPREVSIQPGQTVEWRNTSIETHTVTGRGFDSGPLKSGAIYRHTFSVRGRYDYVCEPHHGLGMRGVVVVS